MRRQPGQPVLVLGQLDLQRTLAGVGVLGEDIEDQRGAVEDLDPVAQRPLQLPLVTGGELVVEDDHVGGSLVRPLDQLLHLAQADEGGRVDALPPLHHLAQHIDPGRVGQLGQFGQRLLDGPVAIGRGGPRPLQFNPHQEATLLGGTGRFRQSGDGSSSLWTRYGFRLPWGGTRYHVVLRLSAGQL
jgi:hypothetical protein